MGSESTTCHRKEAEAAPPPKVAVLTISDTRTVETDEGGRLLMKYLEDAGIPVGHYEILKDDYHAISAKIETLCARGKFGAVITTGGTGISPRDSTFEAVSRLLEKTLPGFGELFRMLSWQEVGAAAMLSRAVAGLRGHTLVFCLPGSKNAISVAMEKLVVPELAHLCWEISRKG